MNIMLILRLWFCLIIFSSCSIFFKLVGNSAGVFETNGLLLKRLLDWSVSKLRSGVIIAIFLQFQTALILHYMWLWDGEWRTLLLLFVIIVLRKVENTPCVRTFRQRQHSRTFNIHQNIFQETIQTVNFISELNCSLTLETLKYLYI